MSFTGFPEQALVFYEGLEADNSKPYWSDHKATYDTCVKAPMEALLAALEPTFGTAKFFRPYRDVRFAKDKTPYKTHAAAVVENPGEGALYLQLSADGLLVAGGYWQTATDQVERLRAAVAGRPGPALARLLADLEADGFEVGGERLRTRPRGYPPDHPRMALLQHKSLTAHRHHPPADWLHTPECLDRVVEGWRALAPLNRWLKRHVGPSRTAARLHR